ncbi:hypothetical protein BDQ17DRAFT_1322574 [Cyathus striatus]|nr:hypothetical protein BDQ17DRAFT_1322574 [Cyathus striatus]
MCFDNNIRGAYNVQVRRATSNCSQVLYYIRFHRQSSKQGRGRNKYWRGKRRYRQSTTKTLAEADIDVEKFSYCTGGEHQNIIKLKPDTVNVLNRHEYFAGMTLQCELQRCPGKLVKLESSLVDVLNSKVKRLTAQSAFKFRLAIQRLWLKMRFCATSELKTRVGQSEIECGYGVEDANSRVFYFQILGE